MAEGIRFASKAEARRFRELRLLQAAGEIQLLDLQPVYPLIVNGVQVGKYLADFRYYRKDGELVVEDVKGYSGDTSIYRLKRRIVQAQYAIQVVEIR